MNKSKFAILYRRVSTKEQGIDRNGLEAQQKELHDFCTAKGYTILADHEEIASGKLDLEGRPILKQVVKDAHRHNAIILVSKLDRLSRSMSFIVNLMNTTCKFVAINLGENPDPFVTQLFASLSEKERKMIGERTKAALQALKARGVKLGGKTSGWEQAKENSAKAIKAEADGFANRIKPAIIRMKNSGMTLQAMADEMNSMSIATARGGKWYATSVKNVISRF